MGKAEAKSERQGQWRTGKPSGRQVAEKEERRHAEAG